MEYPVYSPDLAPNDHYLFPKLKNRLGMPFFSDKYLKEAVEDFFDNFF
jgi:hypothetical protein